MATNWRVYKNDTIAAKLDRCHLPGFFGKKVVVGLNEAAIVLRDGQPLEVLTETRIDVANALDQLKSVFSLGADISVYFLDLAPFDLTIFFGEHQGTAAANAQVAGHFGDETQKLSFMGVRPGESEEQKSSRLREWLQKNVIERIWTAAPGIGWKEQEEEQRGGGTRSATLRYDVSQVSIIALSADRDVISGSCQIRLRIDPEKAGNLLALLKGKRGLASWDIAALIRDEFLASVLVPQIARHPSSSLRGNRGLLTEIESETRQALATTLATFGLLLDNFSINWGLTEQERMEIAGRRAQREEQALEFKKKRIIAHLTRDQEIDKAKIANLQELRMIEATGNEERKTLLLASIAKRNLIIKNNKLDQAQIDNQIRAIDLQFERSKGQLKLEQRRADEELRLDVEDTQFKQRHAARLAEIEASDKEMWSMAKMQIEMAAQKHEREFASRRQELESEFRKMQADIEDRYEQRKLKLEESMARMASQERLVSQGLSTGIATAATLSDVLRQATEQEYATTSDEKVRARSAAQAAGTNLETYRTAQAEERTHQQKMTGLAADMMQAAKQSPAPVIVPGGAAGHPVVVNNAATTSGPPPTAEDTNCPGCQKGVEPRMKFCPFCGRPLQ